MTLFDQLGMGRHLMTFFRSCMVLKNSRITCPWVNTQLTARTMRCQNAMAWAIEAEGGSAACRGGAGGGGHLWLSAGWSHLWLVWKRALNPLHVLLSVVHM